MWEVDISGTSMEAFGSLIVICSPSFAYYASVMLFTSNCHYLFILLVSSSLPPICPPSLYPLTFCSVFAIQPLLSLNWALLVGFKSFFYLLFSEKKKTEKTGDECSEKNKGEGEVCSVKGKRNTRGYWWGIRLHSTHWPQHTHTSHSDIQVKSSRLSVQNRSTKLFSYLTVCDSGFCPGWTGEKNKLVTKSACLSISLWRESPKAKKVLMWRGDRQREKVKDCAWMKACMGLNIWMSVWKKERKEEHFRETGSWTKRIKEFEMKPCLQCPYILPAKEWLQF